MGYCARDGGGDGKAHYFPRVGAILDHVADANARLSIDPTGKVAGYQVIQDDDGLTYTFNGDGADADAGLWVTGAGSVDFRGAYTFNGSDTYTGTGVTTSQHCALDHGAWSFVTDIYQGDSSTYAWQSAWNTHSGLPPEPTVTRNPIASLANWTP